MEQKKTTASLSNSSSVRQQIKDQDTHYHPEPLDRRMDSEYPTLSENDVWFYQMELERHLVAALPANMNKRLLSMVWHLCAQARRSKPE